MIEIHVGGQSWALYDMETYLFDYIAEHAMKRLQKNHTTATFRVSEFKRIEAPTPASGTLEEAIRPDTLKLAREISKHFTVDWGTNDINGTECFTVDVPEIVQILNREFAAPQSPQPPKGVGPGEESSPKFDGKKENL